MAGRGGRGVTFQADRSPSYLYSLENVPPLIFKFQYNPEAITDKKSYKWEGSNYSGEWGFDQTSAAKGFLGTLGGLSTDIKEIGALLINTKPMEPREGDH